MQNNCGDSGRPDPVLRAGHDGAWAIVMSPVSRFRKNHCRNLDMIALASPVAKILEFQIAAMVAASMSATKKGAVAGAPDRVPRSVAVALQRVALLRRVGLHRVDAAALVGAARGGAALLIGGEFAIAGVARLAALQTIGVLHLACGCGGRRCRD
jgi:hypothetical protein